MGEVKVRWKDGNSAEPSSPERKGPASQKAAWLVLSSRPAGLRAEKGVRSFAADGLGPEKVRILRPVHKGLSTCLLTTDRPFTLRGVLSSTALFPEAEVWRRQGRQSLGSDPGAAFRGAGLVGPGSRSHALFPVGAGLERRACAHEEAPPTLVSQQGPSCRRAPGKSQAVGTVSAVPLPSGAVLAGTSGVLLRALGCF